MSKTYHTHRVPLHYHFDDYGFNFLLHFTWHCFGFKKTLVIRTALLFAFYIYFCRLIWSHEESGWYLCCNHRNVNAIKPYFPLISTRVHLLWIIQHGTTLSKQMILNWTTHTNSPRVSQLCETNMPTFRPLSRKIQGKD